MQLTTAADFLLPPAKCLRQRSRQAPLWLCTTTRTARSARGSCSTGLAAGDCRGRSVTLLIFRNLPQTTA